MATAKCHFDLYDIDARQINCGSASDIVDTRLIALSWENTTRENTFFVALI